jgi:ZIP family zinc transporter
MDSSVLFIAFGLTLFAGLSTGIGGALACFAHHTNTKLLSIGLGFSAGVMIYVSFAEFLPEAQGLLAEAIGSNKGLGLAVGMFFLGVLIIALIDRLIPKCENPHEAHLVEEMDDQSAVCKCRHLFRIGVFVAIVVAIHNFPEGLATFAASIHDLRLGIPVAIAVAIHNIPEGIAVALPIYHSTKSRKKAFWYSFLSGLAEPLGALVAYFALSSILNGMTLGVLFALVAGIMVFISLDELLPAARKYGQHHLAMYGLVGGMAVMAVSLLLL